MTSLVGDAFLQARTLMSSRVQPAAKSKFPVISLRAGGSPEGGVS